ncbi:hypothetical protein MRX96_055052 [Rhipicephalus microplus]
MNPSSSIGTSTGVDSSFAEWTRCGRLAAVAAMALVVRGSDRRRHDSVARSHRHTHTRAPPEHLRCPCPYLSQRRAADAAPVVPLLECPAAAVFPSSVRRLMTLVSAAARSLRAMRRLGSSGGSALGSSDPDNRSFGSGTPSLRRASGPVPFFEWGSEGAGEKEGLPRRVAPFLPHLFFCCTRLHHRPPYPDRPGD